MVIFQIEKYTIIIYLLKLFNERETNFEKRNITMLSNSIFQQSINNYKKIKLTITEINPEIVVIK